MGIFAHTLIFLGLGLWPILSVICIPQSRQNKAPVSPHSVRLASSSLQQQIPTSTESPKFWNVRWNGQTQESQLKRVNLDKMYNAALYTGADSEWKDQVLFTFFTKVWTYMTKTYGNFGPDNYLSLVIHQNQNSGSHQEPIYGFSLDPQNPYERNVLNMGSFNFQPTQWASSNHLKNTERDKLLQYLAYFVEYSSKNRLGSPSYNVWKTDGSKTPTATAWVDIFTYDVYKNLNLTLDLERYKKTSENSFSVHPKSDTFWFKNWFLPIYERYGGNAVLNKYFELLSDHFPTEAEKQYKYNGSLDLGGFVHFWSAAAGENLKATANRAFGWTEDFEEQFLRAREGLPGLNQLYNATGRNHSDQPTTANPEIGHKIIQNKSDLNTNPDDAQPPPSSAHSGKPDGSKEFGQILTVGGGVGGAIFLITIFGFTLCIIGHKRKIQNLSLQMETATEQRELNDDEVREFFDGDPNQNQNDAQALVQSKPFIKEFEISRDQLKLDPSKVLGTGQFGSVVHGSVCFQENEQPLAVAMKTVKKNVDVLYFKAFLSEVKIMAYIGRHENIVELYATCTTNIRNREIFIALEFCPLGNLEEYLKKNRSFFDDTAFHSKTTSDVLYSQSRPSSSSSNKKVTFSTSITTRDLLHWSKDIANAMVYLTQKKVIHGDLAARNVLLTQERIAKISDFGLSRQFLNYANYMKTSKLPVPWRWLSIEALKEMKFSTASDIWAFGVTIWEIFSLAEIPYGCWTYDLFFVDKLMGGERLLKPTHANPEIYQLMVDCWSVQPNDRPAFKQIHGKLCAFIANMVRYSGERDPNLLGVPKFVPSCSNYSA